MISPEFYYDEYLQGKSQEEILRQIRSLKQEISRLKRELEEDTPEPKPVMYSSPLTRIKSNREYLEKAKQAYQEAGGHHMPTKAELRDQIFNDSLQHMKRFVFGYGGYFGGYETRTYTISEDKVLLDLVHTFYQKPSTFLVYEPYTTKEFVNGIADLHIGKWKRNYINNNVLDGTQWSIDIEYDNGRRTVHIYGSNAFPYNFSDLLELLGVEDEENDDDPDDEE